MSQEEMEFEVEFSRDGNAPPAFDVYHAHIRCFAVWELVMGEKGSSQ